MKNNIQNDNRKALPKYLLVLLGGGLLGGGLGFLTGFAAEHNLGETAADALNRFLAAITPWGIPVSTLVLLGLAWGKYRSAKKLCAAWDGEDELIPDTADQHLNWALLLTTIQLLLNFFFFSAAVIYWVPGHLIIFAEIGSFLLSIALLIVLQQKVVDLTRKLNPEKQGSVYDLKFRKKWLNSCDEAERKQIGQAAYKAYSVLNATCPILWAVLLLLGFVLEISLLPSFLVLLVWGILNLTYIAECIRMNRHSLPNM